MAGGHARRPLLERLLRLLRRGRSPHPQRGTRAFTAARPPAPTRPAPPRSGPDPTPPTAGATDHPDRPRTRVHDKGFERRSQPLHLTPSEALTLALHGPDGLRRTHRTDDEGRPERAAHQEKEHRE